MTNSNMKVEYIDHMGNDLSIVNSAKASFAKADTEFKPKEHIRLINYLARGITQDDHNKTMNEIASLGNIYVDTYGYNQEALDEMVKIVERYRRTGSHFSPFCHATITLRLKAPIAIHAQFMKHTVGFSHNTISRRYVSDTPEFFIPEFRTKPTGTIKQGSGDAIDTVTDIDGLKYDQEYLQSMYTQRVQSCINEYEWLISVGVAPEQARFVLPQGVMTEWVSTGSLYAWARLYNLRTDSHAQKEIQDLTKMIGNIIEPLYPVSWLALVGKTNG